MKNMLATKHHKRLGAVCGLLLLTGIAHSAQHALIVGIDTYMSKAVNPLAAAEADAASLGKQLVTTGKVPSANVKVLLSSGSSKPTRQAILDELHSMAKRVKPGDTVYFSFAGHGVQLQGGEAALVVYDADLKDSSTIKDTTLSMVDVREAFKLIEADLLVCLYDMCRNDPVAGRSGGNYVSDSFARAVTATSSFGEGKKGPKNVVSLFACSPTQISYEWRAKGRGFFSYFFDQGLSGAAADESGRVTVASLVSYLSLAVPGAVQREISRDQTPMFEHAGAGVLSLVLASGLKPGSAGTTAVPTTLPTTTDGKFNVLYQRGYEAAMNGRFLEAEDLFKSALQLKPNSVGTMVAAGKAFHLAGEATEAQEWYAKAIKVDPDNAEAWLYGVMISGNQGTQGLGRPPFAWKDQAELNVRWDRALKLNQRLPIAWFVAGAMRGVEGIQDSATRRLDELTSEGSIFRRLRAASLTSVIAKPDSFLADVLARISGDHYRTNDLLKQLLGRNLVQAREQQTNGALWHSVYVHAKMRTTEDSVVLKEAAQALVRLNINPDTGRPNMLLDPKHAKQQLESVAGAFIFRMAGDPGDELRHSMWVTHINRAWGGWGRIGWNNREGVPATDSLTPLGNGNFVEKGTGLVWTALGPTLLVSSWGQIALRYL